jgi:hypothetical protein
MLDFQNRLAPADERLVRSYLATFRDKVRLSESEDANGTRPFVEYLFPTYLTQKAEVGVSAINGRGVVAKENISPGELVAIWGGHLMNRAAVLQLPDSVEDHPVQVWDQLWLGPAERKDIEVTDYVNHSCQPSCYVRDSILLIARRLLVPGDEITFDYATTDTFGLRLECRCGAPNCRKIVTGDDWRQSDFRAANRGMLADYMAVVESDE